MSAAPAGEGRSPAAEPSVAGPVPATIHEHAWALMQFELVDGHPVVRQQCEACGLVRRYRAWERYWRPGEGEVRR